MQNNQKIIDRVRKLLNLANDSAAFDGEIDNAMRFARKLMLEHNITDRDINEPAQEKNERSRTYSYGHHVSTWEGVLMGAIVKLFGTIGCYKTTTAVERRTDIGTLQFDEAGNIKTGTELYFYGPEADARDASQLFDEWSHVIATMARLKFGGCFRGNGRSYAEGFATALHVKMEAIDREERDLVIAAQHGTALVLQGARANMLAKQSAAKAWLRKATGIKLRTVRRAPNRNDGNAYGSGYQDGQKSNFTRDTTRKIGAL